MEDVKNFTPPVLISTRKLEDEHLKCNFTKPYALQTRNSSHPHFEMWMDGLLHHERMEHAAGRPCTALVCLLEDSLGIKADERTIVLLFLLQYVFYLCHISEKYFRPASQVLVKSGLFYARSNKLNESNSRMRFAFILEQVASGNRSNDGSCRIRNRPIRRRNRTQSCYRCCT